MGGLAAVLLTWFTLLPPATAVAAERWDALAETVFQNYGREQGLPHPVPISLAQDHDGFLWIGTQGGLARWDGYRFHDYQAAPGVPGTLPEDWVQTIHVDDAGRLWISAGASGLSRYDRDRDRFDRISLSPPGATTGTATGDQPRVDAIIDDDKGGLWVGTDDGLRHVDSATGAVTALRPGTPDGAGLPQGRILALLRDRTGALWAGGAFGLVRGTQANGFAPVPLAGTTTGVSSLFEDEDGRIWIGTLQHGLFAADTPDTPPRQIGDSGATALSSVSALCAAGPHEIWAGLRGGGLLAVDTTTGRVHPIRHDRTLSNSLAHDDVWTLLRDDAGSVWVGGTGGLSYHPRDNGLISTIYGGSQRLAGLSAPDVLSIHATRDGKLWLGYLDGGADLIDPMAGRITTLRPDQSRPEQALPPDVISAITEGDGGTVYFATRRGLYALGQDGSLQRVTVPGRDPQGSVISLVFDAGVLWIGGEHDGLWGYAASPPHGAAGGAAGGKVVFGGAGDTARLTNPSLDILRRGAGRDLWVGTQNGLNRIDLATRAVERIMADPLNPEALPAHMVKALLVDHQDRLWVGTYGGGLAVMTGRAADGTPRFHRFGLADGLPHLNVDALEIDGAGMIWAATDDGLARIDPATLLIHPVRRAEGSALVDYFAGAGATDGAGDVLFGAIGGLTVVRPGPLPPWRFRPPLVVTDLRVGGVPVPFGRFNGAGPIPPPALVISPETNNLAVEFAALDFTAPERNLYAYRLDGFDRDWIEADANRRLAVYTNLPPGHYTLRLRGSNRDGLWTERSLILPIDVLPAWYQRLWFRLTATALLLAAMVMVIRWRTAYLRNRQGELERQIADRTTDLRAANERLGLLAMTDPLTGCANRRHFMERAQDLIALSNRHGEPLSLAILDLDEFKQVNDTYGHPAGDAVLTMTGRLLGGHVRGTDVLGRIGGEEFALLMPHTPAEGAWQLADRLREAISGAYAEVDGLRIHVTASLGVAELYPGEDFDSFYARADAALYAAKQSGRNRVAMLPAAG